MPPSALSAENCLVSFWAMAVVQIPRSYSSSCQQTSSCSRHRDLGTHTRRASHNCHALRYHSGAHTVEVFRCLPVPSAPRTAFWYVLGGSCGSFFLSWGPPLHQSVFK